VPDEVLAKLRIDGDGAARKLPLGGRRNRSTWTETRVVRTEHDDTTRNVGSSERFARDPPAIDVSGVRRHDDEHGFFDRRLAQTFANVALELTRIRRVESTCDRRTSNGHYVV
jgi:hypothetical protein